MAKIERENLSRYINKSVVLEIYHGDMRTEKSMAIVKVINGELVFCGVDKANIKHFYNYGNVNIYENDIYL